MPSIRDRIAVTVAGTVILAVGMVLLVAPGPGLVVVALALAVFAIEYQWARRNLAAVQERARSAAVLLTTVYGVRELRNAKKAEADGDAE